MVELSPEAKKLLAQLREVDEPTAEERDRAHAAATRMLQAHGLRNLPRLRRAGPHQDAPPNARAAHSGRTIKLLWGAGVVATLGILAALATRTPVQRPNGAVLPPVAQSSQPLAPPEPATSLPTSPAPTTAQPPQELAKQVRGAHPPESSLDAELRFLSTVDAEVREGAFASALHSLDHHKGLAQFQEERAALRVLALCGRDNDVPAARARAKFLKGSPSSVLAARVQAACYGGPAP